MHILHAFSTFAGGGPQFRMASIINRLGPDFRHTITAMNGKFGAEDRIAAGIPVVLAPPPPARALYPARLRTFVSDIRPDLLVTYNWGSMDMLMGGLMARVCPIIHHEHGFGPDESVRLKRRRVWTRRVLLRLVRKTVVPSRTLERIALEQYRVPPGKLQLIRNGVDVERFRPERNSFWRDTLGIPAGAIVFAYVGLLRPEKNLGLLLRAFAAARLPESRLLLFGDGACRGELSGLIAALNLEGRAILAGSVSDVRTALGGADVFVMTSDTEQTPMSLLEAMACGLPAVCTGVGDTGEMLGNRPPAVVPPGNLEAYTQALQTVGSDPELRASLGRANRKHCVEAYSFDRMASEWREIILDAARC